MDRRKGCRVWAANLPRWGLILTLGLSLGACETSQDAEAEAEAERAELAEGPWGIPERPGRETEVRDSLSRLRAPQPTVEEREIRTSGLVGPEFYSGTGILARDAGRSRVDVTLGENGRVTLNFANAEVRDVIDIVLGDTLNLSYIIDPAVQGSVTVRTSQPLSRDAVIPALENILALNGVAMTLVDGTYMIVPQEIAAKGLSTPLVSPTEQQLARGFGINIIPLNYASATAMQQVLEPFVVPGSLRADEARNLLIFSGKGRDALDLIEMVEVFDVDWMRGMSFALLPVDVADVKELVSELEEVFLQDGKSPLAGMIRFAPIERLNAVLVISSQPAYLDQAQTWVARLDRGAEGAGRRIFVYYVENARAKDLAEILNEVFADSSRSATRTRRAEVAPGLTPVELGRTTEQVETRQQAAAGEGQPTAEPQAAPRTERRRPQIIQQVGIGEAVGAFIEDSSDIRVIADDSNNALVILATAAEFRMIEGTLRKLDVLPLQVLIEVTIAEVELNDTLKYGVEWFFSSGNFSGAFSTLATGAVESSFPGFSFLFDDNDKQAVLNALTEVTDIKVISSPSLMVLDNQSARLQVGDQVPVSTGESTTGGGDVVTSIQQLDTGVVLEVTPRVNPGGLVLMEIVQEVSTAEETTTSSLDSPTINKRTIETTVAVQTGNTITLGGLIQDQEEEGVSGVPLLSSIPILGNLFKVTEQITNRKELLVLIAPRVVRNQVEARKVTEELRKRLKGVAPLEQKIEVPTKPAT